MEPILTPDTDGPTKPTRNCSSLPGAPSSYDASACPATSPKHSPVLSTGMRSQRSSHVAARPSSRSRSRADPPTYACPVAPTSARFPDAPRRLLVLRACKVCGPASAVRASRLHSAEPSATPYMPAGTQDCG